MKKIANTYLFDFDGTLVDSMPSYVGLMLRILDENNVKYESDIVKIITPLGYLGTAKYFKEMGLDRSVEEMVATMHGYAHEAYTYHIPEKKGVTETLLELKRRGASLNVLTASPHEALDPCLKRLGIFDLFDNVWSCEDFGTTKADPKIYEAAAERLGKKVGEVIFVDDNPGAVKTAKTTNMISCGIFDPTSEEYREEMKRESDGYFDEFSELLSFEYEVR